MTLGTDNNAWPGAPAADRCTAVPKASLQLPETDWKLPTEFPDLSGQGLIAFDVETYDPDLSTRGPGAQRDGRLVGLAIGTEAGFRKYYPIGHETGPNLPREQVLDWARRELGRPGPKVGANLLYDLDFLAAAGVPVKGPFYDIQIAEPLLDENRLSYSLESLAHEYLHEGKHENILSQWLIAMFGKNIDIKASIWRAPAQIVGPYAESDVDLPLRIFAKQKPKLKEQALWDLFILESKLIPMLLAMRQRGVRVDLERAQRLYDDLEQRQALVIEEIKRAAGLAVDIWAAESIAKVFDQAGESYERTKKTRAPSFRREWLESCSLPAAKLLVEARRLDKFKGTFVKGYVLDGHTNGRIHCQFHQLRGDENGTVSGRFSSSHPNLQNVSIRDEELGPAMRSLFLPDEGQLFWSFDWSQIEFRLAVHYAALMNLPGAQEVVEQYKQDDSTDYHEVVARLTGLPRNLAKNMNYGMVYGMGAPKLCNHLNVALAEGRKLLAEYHHNVPFIKPLANALTKQANMTGEIITLAGRHRRFNMWGKDGKYAAEEFPGAKRAFTHKALNALLQGSAADIMKIGMVQIWESGVCDVLGAPHLTVHDELDGSLPPGKIAKEALAEVCNIMQSCAALLVPLKADGGIGNNWSEAK
jgi:DNA polymerase I-like protein with 3'-5' exonuclease and polymerase domains